MNPDMAEIQKCDHPENQVTVTPRMFKDGTTHLERRCSCGAHRGFAPKHRHGDTGRDAHRDILHFGKHKGKTYAWVAKEERSYFEWFLSLPLEKKNRNRKIRKKMEAALAAFPKEVYVPEVLTGERKEAMEELDAWRYGGLEALLKKTKTNDPA